MKKRSFLIMMFIILSSLLFSCVEVTYESLNDKFETHLENNKDFYESYMESFNTLAHEHVLSSVRVIKSFQRGGTSTSGSGFIYKEDETHYYVISNAHVVFDQFMDRAIYEIVDYQGKKYRAELLVFDHLFDLAVLKFEKNNTILPVASMALKNASIGEQTSVIGFSDSQFNTITMGVLLDYSFVDIKNDREDNIDFPVMITNVPVRSGSSGSLVFNDDFKVIGVIFAASIYQNQTYATYAYAVPIEKVIEFLELYQESGVAL